MAAPDPSQHAFPPDAVVPTPSVMTGTPPRATARRRPSAAGAADGGLDPAIEAQIDQFGVLYPFPLDEFQREAIRILLRGDSVMVAAPTGTGKTVVADWGVYEAFRGTGRVLYTTPIKALSNQKYRDLRAVYGDQVGLLTGDVSENRDARVVVMTTEVLRNMLLQTPWDLDDVGCVIFDEIHYLADPERGTTWEEAIILCPDHVQLICLSATVSNAAEIAAWIGRTHRPIRLVTHTERAVPLSLSYFVDGKLHQVVDHTGAVVKQFPHTGGELRRQAGNRAHGRRFADREAAEAGEPQPREIVDALAANRMLPAIYFLFSRNDCQAFAERLAVMRPHLIGPAQVAQIDAIVAALLAGLTDDDRELEQVRLVTALARKGLGFHHAGLLPILKQLVEVLFGRGLMQVVFATDTLALGVNMPARTVVVGRMSKWDGRRRRMLIPNEFQQMAGRAGRRGMDAFGHVVVPYSPWITFRETLEIGTGPLEPVRSAFAIRYNTVLNLWDPPQGERVRAMLQQSLAQFQTAERIRQLEDDIIEIGGDIAGVPQGCLIGLDAGDELLEDYRGLTRTLTAAEGKQRRLAQEFDELSQNVVGGTPWPEPGRQALRRAFRTAPVGLVAHHRQRGWGVFLGHGGRGGVGLFLFGNEIVLVPEYKAIDHLPDNKIVPVPSALIEPPDTIADAGLLVSAEELASIADALAVLDLPDLRALAVAHREREWARVADGLRGLEGAREEADEQVRLLHAAREVHPCHPCPRRKEHRDYLARIDALEKEGRLLETVLERETEAEDARIRGVIRGIRDVLHRFGYLHRGYPTAKADMLADVFDNDGLILCEVVDRGWLDALPADELAECFSWFSFDRDYRYANHYTLPDRLVLLRRRLEDLEHDVLGEERDHGLFISEGHNQAFYGAARAWCRGATMAEIGESLELSEGDLVMTFNKTIDLMRQVREMLADAMPDHPLRESLRAAERLLRRGIVEQSLTLGFAPVADLPPVDAVAGEDDADPAPPPKKRSRPRKAAPEDGVSSAVVAPKPRRRKAAATDATEPAKTRRRKADDGGTPPPPRRGEQDPAASKRRRGA
ncbi:MAG: FIG005666: putative helicase [uncultured Thermomicrobiales bacterium]|uniref:FIG005666: putative helicase n=1 Tax=uncultured Thermomicrobiales bacterium TaxID=1645740 RepID=A0A6J4UW51_9BACT|nr:MAG: FIG005666: putative helicase [uncultured Thermomicrobiales bacterium]